MLPSQRGGAQSMHDFRKITPAFWDGITGRELRGQPEAQVIAMYVLTCRHATSIGVYHFPLAYIANDTGIPIEGASKGLQRICEVDLAMFDEALDLLWIKEMARFQIGEELKERDNRTAAVVKMFEAIPKSRIKMLFFDRYKDAFHLPEPMELKGLASPFKGIPSPFKAPS